MRHATPAVSARFTTHIAAAILSLVVAGIGGCTSGPMSIDETYYLGATNGRDHVYYRVHVVGRTKLGDAEFRQGWFPAEAVDALFGDASEDGAAAALTTREALRSAIDDALLDAYRAYLNASRDPDVTPETIDKHLDAIRRVRLTPRMDGAAKGALVMEYDPADDLVTRHAGQKLVMILASDPDEIINKLAEISESTRTEQVVRKLTHVLAEREAHRRAEDVASSNTRRQTLDGVVRLLDGLAGEMDATPPPGPDRDRLLGRVDAIISVLEAEGN